MNYKLTTISHGTTGVKTITCTFQPIGARITVSSRFGTSENYYHYSTGTTNGTLQICDSFYQDTTAGKTARTSDRLVSHWEKVAGVLTEKVRANFDSFTATEFKYNVITADSGYQFLVEIWG